MRHTKPKLVEMCKKHRADEQGTKAELAARLVDLIRKEEHAKVQTRVKDTKEKSKIERGAKAAKNPWIRAAEAFSGHKYADVPLLWSEERAMLEPCLWPALLKAIPIRDADFFDPWGFDGGFCRSFRSALQSALPCSSPADIERILVGLGDVRCLMVLGDSAEVFFTRHRMKIRALCEVVHDIQLNDMAAQGHQAVAENARQRLSVNVGRYGAGLGDAVSRAISATVKQAAKNKREGSDSDEQPSRRRRRGPITECQYCQAKVTGHSTRKFFEAHNKICKKRPADGN